MIAPILPPKFKIHGKMIWNFNYLDDGKNAEFFIDEVAYRFTSKTSLSDLRSMIEEFSLHLSMIFCTPLEFALQ